MYMPPHATHISVSFFFALAPNMEISGTHNIYYKPSFLILMYTLPAPQSLERTSQSTAYITITKAAHFSLKVTALGLCCFTVFLVFL